MTITIDGNPFWIGFLCGGVVFGVWLNILWMIGTSR